MRERWGTFSVSDHMNEAPFVTDVLLYDRLIIPVQPDPNPTDEASKEFWKKWDPERLRDCLNILKVKTETEDGLALTVPWDASKRERFKNRMSVASALATQHRSPEQSYYVDPFEMTRQLIKDEFRPVLPPGVSKAWTVAAYTSVDAYHKDVSAADPDRKQRQLAARISHRFLTPAASDPSHELLKRAVDLATKDDFRRRRARFYEWQEEIIEENISDDKAIEELEHRLVQYNEATREAIQDVRWRFAFTVIPVALGIGGALLAGPTAGLAIAATGGLIELARFWRFDRKPNIEAGGLDAAAMIHDAREVLSLD